MLSTEMASNNGSNKSKIRQAIKCNYNEISELLSAREIINVLFSRSILSQKERQHLVKTEENCGSIRQAEILLDYLLEKDHDRHLEDFLEVLKGQQEHIFEFLKASITNGGTGGTCIEDLKHHMQNVYKNNFSIIEQLPGERFLLDLSNPDLIMPIDVTAVIVDKESSDILRRRVKDVQQKAKYKKIKLECIEEVFAPDETKHLEIGEMKSAEIRCFLGIGIAGTGKTTILRRFAYEWGACRNKYLEAFDILFFIPLRNINLDLSVLDILGEGKRCLGYLNDQDKDTMRIFLSDENNAAKVLFAIDGIDEVELSQECELHQLIAGQLYSGAKIFLTTRPDEDVLAKLKVFDPDVKIYIKGTNREGIIKYIHASLVKTGGPTNDDVKAILEECEKKFFSFDVLHVPLYLALIVVVFDEYFVKFANFAEFKVPDTMTELFNAFVSVLLKLWLCRLKSSDATCTFKRSPVEKGSDVPIDIQGKLFLMGRMSFECLLKRRYHFTEEDLEEYLVDKNDVKMSGMFSTESNTEYEQTPGVFLFRHKTLQEYLAALYLAHVKLQDMNFTKKLNGTKPITVEELFSPLQLCVKFLFGLSPDQAIKVVENIPSSTVICKNTTTAEHCLDFLYMTELCLEGSDCKLMIEMEKKLPDMKCEDRIFDIYGQYSNFPILQQFAKMLTNDTVMKLLSKHYDLYIDLGLYSGKNSTIRHKGSTMPSHKATTLCIPSLDMTCLALLSTFTFPFIKSLNVTKSMTMDVELFQNIFPSVETLNIDGYPHYDLPINEKYRLDQTKATIQKVTLNNTYSLFSRPLPDLAQENLANLSSLTSVSVHRINVFSNNACLSKWQSLQSLTVEIGLFSGSVDGACYMLNQCHNLKKLHICAIDDMCKCNVSQANTLFKTLSENCKKLEYLALVNVFEKKDIFTYLQNFKLQHFGLGERDILRIENHQVDAILDSGITQFDVHCQTNSKLKLPQILTRLHENPNMNISYKFV